MNDLAATNELFAYTAWADAVVWQAVLSDERARTDERIRGYLLHIHMVQGRFLQIWRAEPLMVTATDVPELASILETAQSTHESLARFLGELKESWLRERIVLPFARRVTGAVGKEPGETTMGDTVLQVVNHSTHHRGQINARMRELGGAPPMTDYIAWVLLGKPAADWPASGAEHVPN